MLAFLREAEGVMASACTGGMILAAAGRLDGKRATTRRLAVGAEAVAPLRLLGERYPQVRTAEARLVDEGAVVTGGGVTLAIDLTLHLVEKFYGADAAAEVTRIVEYAAARRANEAAFAASTAAE